MSKPNLTIRYIDLLGDKRDKVIVEAANYKGTKYLFAFGKHLTPSSVGEGCPLYTLEVARLERFKAHAESHGLTVGWRAA